jgi:hypothetical protein
MKRIVTAFGIGTMLFASMSAIAGVSFIWDGDSGSGSSWRDADNWTAGASWPGNSQTGDTATIADPTTQATCVVDGTAPSDPGYIIPWVHVDADVADGDMTLKIDTGGDLSVLNSGAGYIRLTAGSHSSYPVIADDATLWVAAGSLEVDDIDVDGGIRYSSRGDRGLAYLDIDVAPTINDDVIVTGEANLEIDATTTIGDELIIGHSNYYGDVLLSGNGTVRASSIVINGGDSSNTIVTVSNGAMIQTYGT